MYIHPISSNMCTYAIPDFFVQPPRDDHGSLCMSRRAPWGVHLSHFCIHTCQEMPRDASPGHTCLHLRSPCTTVFLGQHGQLPSVHDHLCTVCRYWCHLPSITFYIPSISVSISNRAKGKQHVEHVQTKKNVRAVSRTKLASHSRPLQHQLPAQGPHPERKNHETTWNNTMTKNIKKLCRLVSVQSWN